MPQWRRHTPSPSSCGASSSWRPPEDGVMRRRQALPGSTSSARATVPETCPDAPQTWQLPPMVSSENVVLPPSRSTFSQPVSPVRT